MSVLLSASTSFSPHQDDSIHFIWHRLHHFCSYSAYLELSRYFFFYDIYLCWISDSRMFIVPILTWSIWNTVSVHWKLLFIMLPQFTNSYCWSRSIPVHLTSSFTGLYLTKHQLNPMIMFMEQCNWIHLEISCRYIDTSKYNARSQ